MKYAYCKILKCPEKSTICLVHQCQFYVETESLEEYHQANNWRSERRRNKGSENEIFEGSKKDGNAK